MSKITVLVHPAGKFWATHEVNGATDLVFGKTTFVAQGHPGGYTEGKLNEKLKKGYVALLNQANIHEQSLFSLETLARTCQRMALSKEDDLGANKDVFFNLSSPDRWKFLRALETHFSWRPGQIERLKAQMEAKQPDGRTPTPTASTAPAAWTAPAGPWSW